MTDKKKGRGKRGGKGNPRRDSALRALEESGRELRIAPARMVQLFMPESSKWTVGKLERKLLERFPAIDAESWDRTGLLVGDPAAVLTGVAVALDPTVDAVQKAAAMGANVLLTHHPAYLGAPELFRPAAAGACGPGTVVWEAIRRNVALMDFHTTLDVSSEAAAVLPGMLGLKPKGILDVVIPESKRGYGQMCRVQQADEPFTLQRLAARCTSVFARQPRVWGPMDKRISTVVTCTGSQGNLARRCIRLGIDCLVCGEVRYHDALEAAGAGLCIIELGHDASELPLCAVLAAALGDLGLPGTSYAILDQSGNWAIPEATRK